MEDESGTGSTVVKGARCVADGRLSKRQEIVEASLVTGASINEVAQRYGVRANLANCVAPTTYCSDSDIEAQGGYDALCRRTREGNSVEGTIEIDLSSRLIRVRGIVDVGMLREVLAATR